MNRTIVEETQIIQIMISASIENLDKYYEYPSIQHNDHTFSAPKSLSSTRKTPQFNTPLSSTHPSLQHQKPLGLTHPSVQDLKPVSSTHI